MEKRLMITEPKVENCGGFLPVDGNGFVVREASLSRIDKFWSSVISIAIEAFVQHYEKQLHSIYVRGSVAAGKAISGHSDLDLVALLRYNFFLNRYHAWSRVPWEAEFEARMQERFPLLCGIELVVASYNGDFIARNNSLPMLLQTQSVCVYGADIIPSLPLYRPNEDMMYYNGRMRIFVGQFLDDLASTRAPELIRAVCRRITKAMIRCGFEFVMPVENRFTRDLYPCYACFSAHYPLKEPQMRSALELYLNPISDRLVLLDLVADLGMWLVANERQLDLTHRPSSWRRMLHQLKSVRDQI